MIPHKWKTKTISIIKKRKENIKEKKILWWFNQGCQWPLLVL